MDTFILAVENVLLALDKVLGSAFYFPYVLLGVGCFFTIYLGFPQVRYFKRAWGVLSGRHTRPDAEGDTTHLQALSTALSGTVGTGNIGGVAFAIFLGGPAALFWMWATAFVGMTTKFVEVTISHKYRVKDDKGEIAGGPMYFMERGLNMKWLAVFFAGATILSTIGSGNMPQSNNMAEGLNASFQIPTWISGLALATLLGLVIIGGIKRIARVATAIVPAMGILYAIGAFAVLATNYHEVGPAFVAVFKDAFTGSAASGGFLGATFAYAFNRGVNRGLFSNEAGQGSAPIAHASARADEPVSEGLVSILEPFLDTLVICTLTGIVILASGAWKDKFDNEFDTFDTEFLAGAYVDTEPAHVASLHAYLNGVDAETVTIEGVAYEVADVEPATGSFAVVDGRLEAGAVTILHKRSIGEDVRFVTAQATPFSGHDRGRRRLAGDARHHIARQIPGALGALDLGGVQAKFLRGVRPIRGDRRLGSVRVQHRHRVVVLRRSGDHLSVRHPLGDPLPGCVRARVLPGDGAGHITGVAGVGGDPRPDGIAEPGRDHAARQGDEGHCSRLLAGTLGKV